MPKNPHEAHQFPTLPADNGMEPYREMDTASMEAPASNIPYPPTKGAEPPEAAEIAGKKFKW